jgi:hypothetical protein
MRASLRILMATSVVVIAGLISAAPSLASFGVTEFTAKAINENGTLDTQAGGHPYEATTSFAFDQSTSSEYPDDQPGNVKDVEIELPPGFIGDPQATPQCPEPQFGGSGCPADTQVGVVTLTFGGYLAGPDTQPVYNIVPKPGHPAEFGFHAVAELARAVILADVNPRNGYQLVTKSSDIPTGANQEGDLPLLGVSFTFWGIPADPSHDAERGQRCDDQHTFGGGCENGGQSSDAPLTPFLTNPTNCQSGPLVTTLRVDSWQNPGHYLTYTATSPQPTGCNKLAFHPAITVEPETTEADTPSGYTFDVKVPQNTNQYGSIGPNGLDGLATPELDSATVVLPRGVSIDPSAANGLAGCTDEEVGIGSEAPVACPAASKIGTAEVFTPLLADGPNGSAPLSGAIYLGTPIPGDEYRVFLAIEGDGVSVRLSGSVSADPVTGQLTATFKENPPLPFSELVLRFFGGSRAALANPLSCGPATTTSDLTPYGAPEVPDGTPASTFQVTGCGNPVPFAPGLVAGMSSSLAGAYSPFTFQLSRGDGQQYISQIATVSLPPGLLGNISAIPLCGSGEAAAGTCGPLSQIGQVTVGAGPGASPFYLGGKVYLTEGYDGDPFGLSVVVPVIAGPYDLGTVVVRAGIQVNSNGSITVHGDTVPTILEGIPLRLRYIGITLERPDFMLNPTNCAVQGISASVLSQQGTTVSLSSPFVASGCAALPFRPVFIASTAGHATFNKNGASLDVRVAQSAGEANIHRVDVQLPMALPSRLTTLQKACTEAQFNANPAGCPEASDVGTARAITPLLSVPLTGPAYLVSHGGKAFPELVLILQGEGVTIDLRGETDIKGKITYSKFETVPDAPITSFELNLPQSPHSALASPAGSLCAKNLTMPTSIEGQNGMKVTQDTQISVTGCTSTKTKPLTRAQKLAKALKACKKHPKKKRAVCEAQARKKYAVKAAAKKSSNHNKKAGR